MKQRDFANIVNSNSTILDTLFILDWLRFLVAHFQRPFLSW